VCQNAVSHREIYYNLYERPREKDLVFRKVWAGQGCWLRYTNSATKFPKSIAIAQKFFLLACLNKFCCEQSCLPITWHTVNEGLWQEQERVCETCRVQQQLPAHLRCDGQRLGVAPGSLQSANQSRLCIRSPVMPNHLFWIPALRRKNAYNISKGFFYEYKDQSVLLFSNFIREMLWDSCF